MEVAEEKLTEFFSTAMPLLDERQRRMVAGASAKMLGRGGVSAVARVADMCRNTVISGVKETSPGRWAIASRGPPSRERAPGTWTLTPRQG